MHFNINPDPRRDRLDSILVAIVEACVFIAVFLIIASMIGGCTPQQRRVASYSTMVLAEGSIACDWRQTHDAAANGWRKQYEANLMLGTNPSVAHVDEWMAGAMVTTAIVGQLIPLRFRPFLYGAVAAVEIYTIAGNLPQTGSCL